MFESGVFNLRSGLAFGHMEVRVNMEATEAEEQITYLYKLVLRDMCISVLIRASFRDGRSTSSFGTWFVAPTEICSLMY
jgi:DNA mismatch repair protein MSH5